MTGPTVGGKQDVSIDDPAVNDLLMKNIARLVSGDGSLLEIVTITKITKQVVAGMKYEITGKFKLSSKQSECIVVIWHREWIENIHEKTKLKAECDGQVLKEKSDDGSW